MPRPTGSGPSAQRIVEDTRELARQLLALADPAAARFPPAEDAEGAAGTAIAEPSEAESGQESMRRRGGDGAE